MKDYFKNIRLTAFASYLPEKIITNADIIESMAPGLNEKILERAVGSKEKRVACKNEMGSDMLAKVAERLLRKSKTDPAEIDKLICSCDPMDQAAPDSSVIAQHKSGLSCPAFGVSMSCVGWICSINNAVGLMHNGDRKILVLASSTVGSKYSFANPMHRAIFGDGAGGVLIQNDSNAGAEILALDILTVGQFSKDIYAPLSWSDVPKEIPLAHKSAFFMSPDNQVFFNALDKYIKPFFMKQFERAKIIPNEVSRFIVHQASMPIFNHTVESFGIPRNKVADYYAKYGNTISAELPIIVDHELEAGRIKKGDIVYFLTYGAGFTAGAMIVKF